MEGRGTENVFHGNGLGGSIVDGDFRRGDVSTFDGCALVIKPLWVLVGILLFKDFFVIPDWWCSFESKIGCVMNNSIGHGRVSLLFTFMIICAKDTVGIIILRILVFFAFGISVPLRRVGRISSILH